MSEAVERGALSKFRQLSYVPKHGDIDGWLSPDGRFFVSNGKDEDDRHDECAHFIVEKDKQRVIDLAQGKDKNLTGEEVAGLNPRLLLQRAGYLLVSFGMPQYLNQPSETQIELLNEGGYILPEEIGDSFRKRIPDKNKVLGRIKKMKLPPEAIKNVGEQIENLYDHPEIGIRLINHHGAFGYWKVANQIFQILGERSQGKEASLEKNRYMGKKEIRYKDVGRGVALIFEENVHAVNDYINFEEHKPITHDWQIYYQKIVWIKKRLEKIKNRKDSYYY